MYFFCQVPRAITREGIEFSPSEGPFLRVSCAETSSVPLAEVSAAPQNKEQQKEQTEKAHDSPNHIYGQQNVQNPAGMSGWWSAVRFKVLVIEPSGVQEA